MKLKEGVPDNRRLKRAKRFDPPTTDADTGKPLSQQRVAEILASHGLRPRQFGLTRER